MIFDDVEVKALFTTGIYSTNIGTSKSYFKPTGGRPLFNEPVSAALPGVYKSQVSVAKDLMKWVLRSPESLGILSYVINDILHGYHFEPIEINASGPGRKREDSAQRIQKAELFAKNNQINTELWSFLFDSFVTGDGYLWKGTPKVDFNQYQEKARGLISKTLSSYNPLFTNIQVKTVNGSVLFPSGDVFDAERKIIEYYDEDSNEKTLEHIPATTVEPLYTVEGVYGFKQGVGIAEVVDSTGTRQLTVRSFATGLISRSWNVDEVIHLKFMSVDGKIFGFSPSQSLLPIITTLQLIKDHHGHFFDNSGIPPKAFIFKKANPNHPSVKALEEVLSMAKLTPHKQRNLIITSEMEMVDLNRFDKDMEFRQLAIYYTGLIALAFCIPMDRIMAIVVDKKSEGSDTNDSDYWRRVGKFQRDLADLFNSQFFNEEFGVNIVFDNPFEQDKIRKAQKEAQMWAVANSMLQMGASQEYVLNFLEIPQKYRSQFKLKEIEKNPFQQDKSPDNSDNQKLRNQKREEQNKKEDNEQIKNEGF